MKNLIRNGGFERGTIDFWTGYNAASFVVSSTNPYKGSFCGQLEVTAGQHPYVMPNDYIPLVLGESLYFEAFVRGSHNDGAVYSVVYYDEGLNEIEEISDSAITLPTSSYTQILRVISGKPGAMYVKPKIRMNTTSAGHYIKIDNALMYRMNDEVVMSSETVMENLSFITSAGTRYSDWTLTPMFEKAEFILDVQACIGANETLDVTIEARPMRGMTSYTIATFKQVTTVPNLQTLLVTAGLASRIRVKSVIGGSPSNVGFLVFAIFKR